MAHHNALMIAALIAPAAAAPATAFIADLRATVFLRVNHFRRGGASCDECCGNE
jgi:hypothetical protein